MRARLLDLGDVNVVRSQSICHAVAAATRPGDVPAVILLRPRSPYVAIGHQRDVASEVDLDFCRRRSLPVIPGHLGEVAVVRDENQLLLFVVVAGDRAAGLGLPPGRAERWKALARAGTAAYRTLGVDVAFQAPGDFRVAGRRISDTALGEIGEAVCFAAGMVFDFDEELVAGALKRRPRAGMTSLRRELPTPPGPAEMAEALIAACESCFGLELVPSMPTPEELDAIYEWDERLAGGPAPLDRLTA